MSLFVYKGSKRAPAFAGDHATGRAEQHFGKLRCSCSVWNAFNNKNNAKSLIRTWDYEGHTVIEEKRSTIYNKASNNKRSTLYYMRRQKKVGVYQTKIPKGVLRTCAASRRNGRGLGINEESALLSPWQ